MLTAHMKTSMKPKRSPRKIGARVLAVWLFEEYHWVLPYSRNERDRPCDDRTTGAAAHSRAEESAVGCGIGRQGAKRDAMYRVRPRLQSLDAGASGWYRCSGCIVSDGVVDSSGEKRIS